MDLNLETLDDVMLPRWYDSTQHLYEGEPLFEDLPPCEAAIECRPATLAPSQWKRVTRTI